MKKLLITLAIFSAMFSFVITNSEEKIYHKKLYKGGQNGKQIEWQIK